MGLLSLAKTVPSSIGTLVTTLGNVFTPHYTILYAKNDIDGLVSEVKLTSKIVSIIMTVPIAGFIALGKEFYTLWQPTKTADEILMIQILSVITCLMFIFACHTQCLMMLYTVCNKLKVPVFVNLGIGVVSTATVLLVLRFGNLGDSGVYVIAGVSSLLMSLRAILFMPMYSAKILGRKLTTFYPPILRGWLCFAVVFGAFFAAERLITIDSWVKLLIACLVLGVLGYALSVPLMLSRKEMKAVINKVKNKVKKKKAPSPAQPSAPSEDDGRVYGGRSCCGCSACADSCPKGAITMRPDEFGFVYPEIDEQLCVHCGKCRRACTFNRREEVAATETARVYAVRSSDPVKLSQSSSGVIIPEIAGEIIARGGAVVAAAFDGDIATFFDPLGVGDGFCGIDAGESYILDKVVIMSRDGWNARFNGAMIQGSNDGENWTTLWTSDGEGTNPDWYTVTEFENNTGYSQFRYYNTTEHGDVAEVEFYGNPGKIEEAPVDQTLDQKAEAPNTFDFGILAAVSAVASLGGFVLTKKKH